MRFFHLSDLHIGKQLHRYNLKEDQEYILEQIISRAEELRPDAVLIAGDVYDKSVPSGEAVSLFDDFLTRMSKFRPSIPIIIIAGNHDSGQRIDYASRLLGSSQIYISGSIPQSEEEHLKKVTLEDAWGKVHFYLLPFLKPGYVRGLWDGPVESYTDAVRAVLERETIDTDERNVLLSHQFFVGNGEIPSTCDSEILTVGGIDSVDISVVQAFDYVALGHLHGAQKVGRESVRYCGTVLKYSVSEAGQEKSLHLVELGPKGAQPVIRKIPLKPLRDVRRFRGTLEEILEAAKGQRNDDYVSITLTDEVDPYKPKEQLEKIYSHILEVRMDNERTRKKLEFSDEDIRIGSPESVFEDFYREMQGRDLNQEERKIVQRSLRQE